MKKKCTLLIFIIVGCFTYSQAMFNEIIEAGDLPRLKDTIDLLDYDVKKIDEKYDSLLYIACQEQQYEIAEWLLNNGAPIDVENYFGLTPLAITVRLGNEKIAKLLIDRGADLGHKFKVENIVPHDYYTFGLMALRDHYLKHHQAIIRVMKLIYSNSTDMQKENIHRKAANDANFWCIVNDPDKLKICLKNNADISGCIATAIIADSLEALKIMNIVSPINWSERVSTGPFIGYSSVFAIYSARALVDSSNAESIKQWLTVEGIE